MDLKTLARRGPHAAAFFKKLLGFKGQNLHRPLCDNEIIIASFTCTMIFTYLPP